MKKVAPSGPASKPPAAPAQPKKAAPAGRLNPIKLRQMKQRRREIEDEITRMEVEIADYEAKMNDRASGAYAASANC